MFRLITALVAAWTLSSCSSAGAGDDIAGAIKTLTPSLSAERVGEYSRLIRAASLRYDIEWPVLVVILKQESNFDPKAVNFLTRDFGMGQVHYKTLQDRKIDLGSLLTDTEYAINETAKILYDLKLKYSESDKKRGRKWYTRYNSYTPEKRDAYRAKLDKHLKAINKVPVDVRPKTEAKAAKHEPQRSSGSQGACKGAFCYR